MKAHLLNFDPTHFMRNHWQQKPLFVKNALAADFIQLRPADLFKLAHRPEVESRFISRKNVRNHWRYRADDGPFEKHKLAAYKTKPNWTLLVQRVNEWLPRVDLFFEYFKFIANWRIDDIMISYATPGGTVGPHLDNYDVFLCQLQGNRTWQYSRRASKEERLETGQPVRLLTDFKNDSVVVARPGDMLYIPPKFAHYGIADTESITVSVGFRAPQVRQLMGILLDGVMSQSGEQFYGDKGAGIAGNPGQLDEQALKKLFLLGKSALASGTRNLKMETLSDTLLSDLSATPNAQIARRKKTALSEFKSRWQGQSLQRNPRNQYFYRVGRGGVILYAAGESFTLPASLEAAVADFCNTRIFTCTPARLKTRALAFWHEMYALGFVFFQK